MSDNQSGKQSNISVRRNFNTVSKTNSLRASDLKLKQRATLDMSNMSSKMGSNMSLKFKHQFASPKQNNVKIENMKPSPRF